MKKILFTGGGTGGHVTPNIAIMEKLQEDDFEFLYIGREEGIEKELIEKFGVKYKAVTTGKLRRYFSVENFKMPFRVIKGIYQAYKIIKEEKPDLLFSKGGFVSVPVVIGAKLNGVPIVAHESDITPGLATIITKFLAEKICISFPETANRIPVKKAVLTGAPIRREFLNGDKEKGLKKAGLTDTKPIILVMGGSSGSKMINKNLRFILSTLLEKYQIIHLCGKENAKENLKGLKGYTQFEYVSEGLEDLFAASDLIISRAGANSIFEIIAAKKLNILIPLSKDVSRGDQILNAISFEKQGLSVILKEKYLNEQTLLNTIERIITRKEKYINKIKEAEIKDGVKEIIKVIKSLLDKKS